MSLDAIMDERKAQAKTSKPNKSKAAPAKKAGGKLNGNNRDQRKSVPYLDRTVDDQRPKSAGKGNATNGGGSWQRGENVAGSVFNRIGGGTAAGCTVLLKNLSYTVSSNDVTELCKAIGKVTELKTSKGFAEVTYANKGLANQCVSKYNGLSLDGRTMAVEIKQEVPASVFNRIQGAAQLNMGGGIVKPTGASFAGVGKGRNVAVLGNTIVSIKKDQNSNNNNNRERNNKPQQQQQQQRNNNNSNKPNAKRDNQKKKEQPKKPIDLDADLDAYMGKSAEKVAQEKAKSLDDDLDSYMAARSATAAAPAVEN